MESVLQCSNDDVRSTANSGTIKNTVCRIMTYNNTIVIQNIPGPSAEVSCGPHCARSPSLTILLKHKIWTKYVEIKCQLDATEVFIADLIACSTCFGHHYARHPELKSIIRWLLPVVFRAVVFKLLVWCGA